MDAHTANLDMRYFLICLAGTLLFAPAPTDAQVRWEGRGSLSIFGAVNDGNARGSYGLSGGPILNLGRVHVPIRASLMLAEKQNAICQSAIKTESGACTDLLAWASASVLFDVVNQKDFDLYLGAGGDAGWLTDFHGVGGIQYKPLILEVRVGPKQFGVVLGLSSR